MNQIFSIPFNSTIEGGLPLDPPTDSTTASLELIYGQSDASPKGDTTDHRASPKDSSGHVRAAELWKLPDCQVVRTQEAALMLTRSVRTLQNWRYNRRGPQYQLGRTVTYRIGDLKAYVEGCTVSSSSAS